MRGEVEVTLDDNSQVLSEGGIITLPQQLSHGLRNTSDLLICLVEIQKIIPFLDIVS